MNNYFKYLDVFKIKLEEDFPILFSECNHAMIPYVSALDAWQKEVYECCEKLSAEIIKRDKIMHPLPPNIEQIKEKFGVLRFYIHIPNNTKSGDAYDEFHKKLYKIIEDTENKCTKICNDCGMPGKPRKTFPEHDIEIFIMGSLCDKCLRTKALLRSKFSRNKKLRQWYFENIVCTEFIGEE